MDIQKPCEICGYASQLGAVAQHRLIPEDVTKQAGMPKSKTVSLCCNCHFELDAWYRKKVSDEVYDPKNKRFREKSWEEQVKDYESAFSEFKKYKGEPRKLL